MAWNISGAEALEISKASYKTAFDVNILLDELSALETELHSLDTRLDVSRMEELLHPQFEEFGRSGRKYCRDEALSEFTSGTDCPRVVATGFEVAELGDGVALLTYKSAHRTESGKIHRCTLRSSLWLRTDEGWRLRFHQGTPIND